MILHPTIARQLVLSRQHEDIARARRAALAREAGKPATPTPEVRSNARQTPAVASGNGAAC
ncbi:MAG: hypothetical protein JO325_04015 [Solirubrobacterales bacterium]|nr:hypothetical protein [Solirubrobacterales bacterium]